MACVYRLRYRMRMGYEADGTSGASARGCLCARAPDPGGLHASRWGV
jgi:hypothetical protein